MDAGVAFLPGQRVSHAHYGVGAIVDSPRDTPTTVGRRRNLSRQQTGNCTKKPRIARRELLKAKDQRVDTGERERHSFSDFS